MKDRYLFVVAHPDDELLGAGGTIINLINKGIYVAVLVLSCNCNTRKDNLEETLLKTDCEKIGINRLYYCNFQCLKFKDEDNFTMVNKIEEIIKKVSPTIVITHHPYDLNPDHYYTSIACQQAVRLPQRLIGYDKPIRKFMYMEVPSETDFAFNNSTNGFVPNTYYPICESDLSKKIEALKMYDYVVRENPHPRSKKSLEALSIVRGTQCGSRYAEAFQTVFEIGV